MHSVQSACQHVSSQMPLASDLLRALCSARCLKSGRLQGVSPTFQGLSYTAQISALKKPTSMQKTADEQMEMQTPESWRLFWALRDPLQGVSRRSLWKNRLISCP